MAPLTELELERERRIAANNQRMAQLLGPMSQYDQLM